MAIETWPVEEAVRAVPGVRSVRSTTSRGSADISVGFDWGTDMVSAMLEVQSSVGAIVGSLPPGTVFDVRRMDPTVFPVLGYALTSDTLGQVELQNLALFQMRPVFSTAPGVSSIAVQGGDAAEVHVTVDPAKLLAFGLTIDDVASALSAANVLTAVGRIEEHDKLALVLSDTRLDGLDSIRSSVIRSGADGLVLLEDIATVSPGTEPRWTRVTVTVDREKAAIEGVDPELVTKALEDAVTGIVTTEIQRTPKMVGVRVWLQSADRSSAGPPLAIAIIAGLAVQVPLVLTVLPALLALMRRRSAGA